METFFFLGSSSFTCWFCKLQFFFQEIEHESAKHFKEEENEKQDADEVINSSIEDKGILRILQKRKNCNQLIVIVTLDLEKLEQEN